MPKALCVLSFMSALAVAGGARAQPVTGEVKYAPPASWVLPPPPPTSGAAPPEAPFRFVYTDQQIHLGPAGEENYTAYRIRILKPEALQIGNLSLDWNPKSGGATVHRLRIIRGDETIDLLKDQRFQVIQREGGLERSILDGNLTAMLQASGLRVGDEVEFAVTVTRRDPTLGDHAFGLAQLPMQGMPGAFRYRLSWPAGAKIAWRTTRDLPQAVPATEGGRTSVSYELRDPGGVILNDGAPPRYNVRRLIDYSDFAGWGDVSRRFALLFDKAAALETASPLRGEAARIMAASADPAERLQAALQLVQDQIRYVYVGLDGGNYRPASADETWRRRFGDCKAKTALLLALLREMKIAAEPVLVNAFGGDGGDARLPSPAIFNHVLVRATIGGGAHYWLDGTRLGDRYLDRLPPPAFRWALALRPGGSELEAVAPQPPERPLFIAIVDVDARSGFDKAKVTAQHVLRQDEAFATNLQLAALSAEEADRAVRGYWRQQMAWVEPDKVSWRYDARGATLLLSLSGAGKPDWEGDDTDGRSLDIISAGFVAPELRRRPKEQDQSAPWQTEFPRFKCYATSIRLPASDAKWRWTYYADPMATQFGGVAYWRASGLRDGTMRTVMSSLVDRPEIDAEAVRSANGVIPQFNNKISRVYQVAAKGKAEAQGTLPFGDGIDWTADAAACRAPPASR